MAPKKLIVEDLSRAFEPGVVISAQTKSPVRFETLVSELTAVQIVYIGERHTDRSHHKIQLDLIRALYQKNPDMQIGMEMFDHSYQPVLDAWTGGRLDLKPFLEKVHWYANWRFDFELYRPILEFAKENKIRVIGLNLPMHIPPKIRVGGLDNLSDADKRHLATDIDLSNEAHQMYLKEIFSRHHGKAMDNFAYFYAAQCAWEDTMAQAVARYLDGHPMVVLAGNGHIIRKFGIPDRVFNRTRAPFSTVVPATAGQSIRLSAGDYIWVASGGGR